MRDYGLHQHAARLWTKAAGQSSTEAAWELIMLLKNVSPGSITQAVARLLVALRETGADAAATVLATRAAAVGIESQHLGLGRAG
jgi:hypothetical protein